MPEAPGLSEFPLRTHDTLRYSDTDRQGHVNGAVFATFFETGRVQFLYDPVDPLIGPGFSFVVASLYIDYLAELTWPGTVVIGTRLVGVGRSSLKLEQGLFQNEACAATAKSVIVLVNGTTRRSHPLPADAIERLYALGDA